MTLKEYCTQIQSSKLLDEWSDKNGDLTPAMVLTNSLASIWWQCSCGCFREEVRKENFKNNIHFMRAHTKPKKKQSKLDWLAK